MIEQLKKMTFEQFFCMFFGNICFIYFFWISHMAFVFKGDMPTDVSEIKMAVVGAFGSIVGFVIGSSVNSRKKDETISKAMESGNTPPPGTSQTTFSATSTTTDTKTPDNEGATK